MTAVEWLYQELDIYYQMKSKFKSKKEIIAKAKEIEKQQIIDSRVNGVAEGIDIGSNPVTEDISKNHEIYYNETFKKK